MQATVSDYIELTKPRINCLVLVTAALGYVLGGMGKAPLLPFIFLLIGTGSTSAGAAVLNNFLERDVDAKMKRTAHRPIPAGRIAPAEALSFGILLVLFGTFVLATAVNVLSGFLAILSAFLYVLVYTPMKRISWLNTFIGAIPGAIPPLGGWAAATGTLDKGAWALFLILFIWQHPHFFAIAWMYRDDYRRGGFKMLPAIESDGRRTFRQIFIYSLLLVPASLLPFYLGMSGIVYFIGALTLSTAMLAAGTVLCWTRAGKDARRVLHASIIYLPLLLVLVLVDSRILFP